MTTGVRLPPEKRRAIMSEFKAAKSDEARQRTADEYGVTQGTIRKWIRFPRYATSVTKPRPKTKGKKKGRSHKGHNAAASASNSHDGIYYLRQILKLARERAGPATGVNDFDIIGAYAVQGLAALERVR